jgi:oligoribonuclease NrnB/cAMP/cGMP phosphodiesterase (DHH superfamily)
MPHKQIVVIYHKACPDGFGAAYAAWKKFGDSASYVEAGYGDKEVIPGLAGKEVYLLDFCYELPGAMDELARTTRKLVVLDHHRTTESVVKSIPEHVYDDARSGATIAWNYFHPNTRVPQLLSYLEDGDLYRYALPETQEVYAYIIVQPQDFQVWDDIVKALEDDERRASLLTKAFSYCEYFELIAGICVQAAKKVRFEGRECYFATAIPQITMRSEIASQLYKKLPPFAIIVTAHPDGLGVSIRGDGSVDVSKIAEKYGGGGHPGSAGFFIPNGETMPWVELED